MKPIIEQLKELMRTDKFVIYMNLMRIATLIGIVFLIYVLLKEIETVKLLGKDVCKLCIEKSNCNCFCLKPLEP